jgi:hypothetical protein
MNPFQNLNAARRHRWNAALPVVLALFLLANPVTTFAQGRSGTIRGTVTAEETGEPIAASTVGLLKPDGTPTMVGAFTNAEGEYVIINVPPGRYHLRAVMSDYKTVEVEALLVTIGVTTRQNFQLEKQSAAGTIRGTVTDEAGNPMAAVNLVLLTTLGRATSLGSFTDSDGKYVIINVPEGRYHLRAVMVNFKTVEVQQLLVTSGVTTRQSFQMEKLPPQ